MKLLTNLQEPVGFDNLAAKLSLALLPPNSPFFRLSPAEEIVAEIEKNADMKQKISIRPSKA